MKTPFLFCSVVVFLWFLPCRGQTIGPVADAYVRDGIYAGRNFGTESELVVKNDARDYNRVAYLTFSLTNVGSAGTARLRLYGRRSGSSLNLFVSTVAGTSWNESLITWSSAPARGAQLGTNRVDSSSLKLYEFDVSSYVRSQQAAGRAAISFSLHCAYNTDSMIYVPAREASANQPRLVLVSNSPPVVGLRSDIVSSGGGTSNTVTLSATASDPDGQVSRLEFRASAATLVVLSNAPYAYTWSNAPPGQYEITAVAFDNLGLRTVSAATTVVIPPAIGLDTNGLVGAWNFDEGAGLTSADLTGRGHHATLASDGRWVAGRSNTAVSGVEITIPNTTNLLPRTGQGFTVSMWINPQSVPVGWSALAGSGSTPSRGWRFGIARDSAQTNLLFWSTENGGTLEARAPCALATGRWHHVAITFDGAAGRVYLNGMAAGVGYGGIIASTSLVQVAAMSGLQTFPGAVDELRVYGRALSAHELGPVGRVSLATVLQGVPTNILFQGQVAAGRTARYEIVAPGPTNGFLSSLSSTQVLYTPQGRYKGPDAFQYTVSDGTFTSAPVTVVISVVTPHYISPKGGSLLQDGSAPERAWAGSPTSALDEIIRTNNWYDCFFYSEGVFEMSGGSYGRRRTANWGCKHIGSGAGTVLRYVNAWDEVNDDTLFNSAACGPAARIDDFEISNLIIDCNASGNPKMTSGLPYVVRVPLGGARVIDAIRIVWDRSQIAGMPAYTLGHAREFGVLARRPGMADYVLLYTNAAGVGGINGVETITGFAPIATDEVLLILGSRGNFETNKVGFYGIRELEVFSNGANVVRDQPITASDIPEQDKYLEWGGVAYVPARAVDGDYNTQWASRGQGQVGAVALTGNNVTLRNLRIINFGTTAGRECFPFGVTDGCYSERSQPLGNILIENVTITSPARTNGDGCTALVLYATKPMTMTNAVVRNCRVAGLRDDFTYSHAFSTLHLENSFAMRCSQGWYIEPASARDDIGPVLIRSNEFLRCDIGICAQFHPGTQFSTIVAENNQFFHDNTYPSWSLLFVENGQNVTTNIILNRNMISRAAGPSAVDGTSGGVFFQSVWNALVGNHRFEIMTNFVGMASSLAPAGARRAFFGNTNAAGALVPVWDYSSGMVLTNAQWPY